MGYFHLDEFIGFNSHSSMVSVIVSLFDLFFYSQIIDKGKTSENWVCASITLWNGDSH